MYILGANGLRGGRNSYSHAKPPEEFTKGFSTKQFETEAMSAQQGATLETPTYYGSDIVKANSLCNKTIRPTWETTARSMHNSGTLVKVVQNIVYIYTYYIHSIIFNDCLE